MPMPIVPASTSVTLSGKVSVRIISSMMRTPTPSSLTSGLPMPMTRMRSSLTDVLRCVRWVAKFGLLTGRVALARLRRAVLVPHPPAGGLDDPPDGEGAGGTSGEDLGD